MYVHGIICTELTSPNLHTYAVFVMCRTLSNAWCCSAHTTRKISRRSCGTDTSHRRNIGGDVHLKELGGSAQSGREGISEWLSELRAAHCGRRSFLRVSYNKSLFVLVLYRISLESIHFFGLFFMNVFSLIFIDVRKVTKNLLRVSSIFSL